MTPKRQVVVIGSGVVGAICALECLRAGHDVTIVDPFDPQRFRRAI